jgi:hypothetical protein
MSTDIKVICLKSHEDGVTEGKEYSCVNVEGWVYDIFPDDFGHLSGWHKSYFAIADNNQNKQP